MLAENSGEDLRADVLKVGHHGSKNSTTQEFLEAVRPQVAIYFGGRRQSVWAPESGTAGAASKCWGARVADGSGWRGAHSDGWKQTGNFVLCGLRQSDGGNRFRIRANARSKSER